MKIEDKLKTINDEIPKSPTYMKQKVMNLIKSPSKLHNKGFKFNLYKLIPLLSISVLIIVLIIVGITNKDTLLPNNNQDNEVSKVIYESDINDYLFYQVTIENNKYNYNDEINLLVEYDYKDITNKSFDNLLITIEASSFEVLSEESILVNEIGNNNQVTFKLKLNENNTTSGNIKVKFKSIIFDDNNIEESNKDLNATLEIDYNAISTGIKFQRKD